MKTFISRMCKSVGLAAALCFGAAGLLLVDAATAQQAAAQDVDEGYFYTSLAPYGQWSYQVDLGWVWHPAQVGPGWRPYTEGQWVWTSDSGWIWTTNEPWGWATYHYGRWYFDPVYGWSWVPGRIWAPAWVSWRIESGYIGWAPLWPVYFDIHPEYRWDHWRHDNEWERRHHDRDWDRWIFIRDRDFTAPRVGSVAIRDVNERDRIFRQSRDVTVFDENRPERIGRSIDRALIERAVGRPVQEVRIETVDSPDKREVRGDTVKIYRPRVQERPDRTPDKLGVAKPPPSDAREVDTIKQEKKRLESIPEDQKPPERNRPQAREKDTDRGGAPETIDRRDLSAPAVRAGDKQPAHGQPAEIGDKQREGRDVREPADAGTGPGTRPGTAPEKGKDQRGDQQGVQERKRAPQETDTLEKRHAPEPAEPGTGPRGPHQQELKQPGGQVPRQPAAPPDRMEKKAGAPAEGHNRGGEIQRGAPVEHQGQEPQVGPGPQHGPQQQRQPGGQPQGHMQQQQRSPQPQPQKHEEGGGQPERETQQQQQKKQQREEETHRQPVPPPMH